MLTPIMITLRSMPTHEDPYLPLYHLADMVDEGLIGEACAAGGELWRLSAGCGAVW